MLLENCTSFALDGTYERFSDLGRTVNAADSSDSDKTAAEKFLKKLGEICSICELPTLEKYGIDKDKLMSSAEKMSDDALTSGSPGNTINAVSKDDILSIYRSLWNL